MGLLRVFGVWGLGLWEALQRDLVQKRGLAFRFWGFEGGLRGLGSLGV